MAGVTSFQLSSGGPHASQVPFESRLILKSVGVAVPRRPPPRPTAPPPLDLSPTPTFRLVLSFTPAEHDALADDPVVPITTPAQQAEESAARPSVRVVLATVSPTMNAKRLHFELPSGSEYRLALIPVALEGVSKEATLTVTVVGEIQDHVESAWRMLGAQRWFVAKPGCSRVRLYTKAEQCGTGAARRRAAVQRGARTTAYIQPGDVHEAAAVSIDGKWVRWAEDGRWNAPAGYSHLSQLRPFEQWYTPAREDKPVRVRRHPMRSGDVLAVIPHGTQRRAVGIVLDTARDAVAEPGAQPDAYAVWEDLTYSRLHGANGAFLKAIDAPPPPPPSDVVNTPKMEVPVSGVRRLDPTQWVASARDMKPVRIRDKPSVAEGKVVGELAANEVREACGEIDDLRDGSLYVEWCGGGYSRMRGPDGAQYLRYIPPVTSTLRLTPVRSAILEPPTPEVVEFGSPNSKRRAREEEEAESSDAEEAEHYDAHGSAGRVPRHDKARRSEGVTDPALTALHQGMAGKGAPVALNDLPRASLTKRPRTDEEHSDEEEEEEEEGSEYDEDGLDFSEHSDFTGDSEEYEEYEEGSEEEGEWDEETEETEEPVHAPPAQPTPARRGGRGGGGRTPVPTAASPPGRQSAAKTPTPKRK